MLSIYIDHAPLKTAITDGTMPTGSDGPDEQRQVQSATTRILGEGK